MSDLDVIEQAVVLLASLGITRGELDRLRTAVARTRQRIEGAEPPENNVYVGKSNVVYLHAVP